MVTQERLKQLLNYNAKTGDFYWLESRGTVKAGTKAGSLDRTSGYHRIRIDKRNYFSHRIAWIYSYGDIPSDMEIDHKDRNKLNNRLSNLRVVTASDNQKNVGLNKNNTSGLSGISFYRNSRYRVTIGSNGVSHYLGTFLDYFEAVCARKAAENEYGFSSP